MIKRLVNLLALFLVVALIFAPHLLWRSTPTRSLNLFVLDKTVPQADYREHQGLFWILEHFKIVRSDGEPYRADRDYYGYHPTTQRGDYLLQPHGKLDLIYVTDAYGVYQADLGQNPRGERSELVYGGLTVEEWEALVLAKGPDTTLIAEFNALASPTDRRARRYMEADLGITWNGWVGRHFPDLESPEVPIWLVENYEQQWKQPWAFKGPGIAFVHESDQVLVLGGSDMRGQVMFQPTEAGRLHYPNLEPTAYGYWFDLVAPHPQVTVEATFQIELTEAGSKKLAQFGLPEEFPAVLRQTEQKTYYFAGDFADLATGAWTRWSGFKELKRHLTRPSEADGFYWRVYVPMMEQILAEVRPD